MLEEEPENMEDISLEDFNTNGNNKKDDISIGNEDNEYFWLPKKKDIFCWLANAFSMIIVYIYMKRRNYLINLFYFQDTPQELIYARHHSTKNPSSLIAENFPYYKIHSLVSILKLYIVKL